MLANHNLVLPSVKEHEINVDAKTEGVASPWVFIWRLRIKYYEIFCESFKDINIVEEIFGE